MIIINYDEFKKWALHYNDYILKGGLKPINRFPLYFTYQNMNSYSISNNLQFTTKVFFHLKCFWNNFSFDSISNFHREKNVSYFAKELDYLEIRQNEVIYEVNLNMEDHIGKAIFQMKNYDFENEDFVLLQKRIFLPKLNLTFIDIVNELQIVYTQNKSGIGVQESFDKHILNESDNHFYFNKPFIIHIYIDMIKLLSIYVESTDEIQYSTDEIQ